MERAVRPDLSIAQAAELLGVHRETIRRHLRTGETEGFKVGRQWRIRQEVLDVLRHSDGNGNQ